jgi:DNA-binding CsgD family transcriptional regulator
MGYKAWRRLYRTGRTVRLAENGGLSERERQILRLVATGASNKEIAHRLVIATNTVKVHLRNIFAKIGVVSRTEATLYAIREGLVQVGEARPAPEPAAEDAEVSATPGETVDAASAAAEVEELDAPSPWARLGRWRAAAALAGIILVLLATAGVATVALAPTPTATPLPPTAQPSPAASAVVLAAPSRWQARASMPTARAGLGAAAYDGLIYAVAGETASGPTGVLERYDPVGNVWTTLAPKPVAVADVSAAVVGGRIYVPGGRLASGAVTGPVTSTMEAYDPARDVWEQRAPLPVAVSAYALVAFEGRLYLFGGWDGARFLASVYEYDPARDAWTVRTPMPTARGFAGAAAAGSKVYVVGGYDGETALAVNEEYTPSREGTGQAWTARSAMPEGRAALSAIPVVDQVYVVGGGVEQEALPLTKFSIRTDSWQEETDLSSPLALFLKRMALSHVDDKVFVLGGWDGRYRSDAWAYQALFTVIVPPAPGGGRQ